MAFLSTKDIKIAPQQLWGAEDDVVFLKSMKEIFQYVDNKATDTVIGNKYFVELPHHDNLYLGIKILGDAQVTQADIEKAGKLPVRFHDVSVKIYSDFQNRPALSVSASRLEVIQ